MNSKENQVFNLLLIEYIFSKKSTKREACNFIKKETLAQEFSCEFCEISKNTFFAELLWTTASNTKVMEKKPAIYEYVGKR